MDLDQLYREVIMDHYKNPRNKGLKEGKDYRKVTLHNPSCGDEITVEVLIKEKKLVEVNQDGQGCSICCSSASVMSEALKNKTLDEAKQIIKEYLIMLTGQEFDKKLINGEVLSYIGVCKFPARVRCASIAWKALETLILEAEDESTR